MNIGISIENDFLYVVADEGEGSKPAYHKSRVKINEHDNDKSNGYIWDQIENEEFRQIYLKAGKIVLTVPAAICYTRKISLDSDLAVNDKEYLAWVAHNRLPGDISKYIYGFIPSSRNSLKGKIEVFFYAAPSDQFWRYFCAAIKDESYDRVCLLPEFVGLRSLLRKTVRADAGIQAGMVNMCASGAAAVFISNDILFSNRYFPYRAGKIEELKTDLETYFLSLIDPGRPADIFIGGKEDLQALNLGPDTRIKFNRMSAGFISALGSVEYVSAGGKCELPEAG